MLALKRWPLNTVVLQQSLLEYQSHEPDNCDDKVAMAVIKSRTDVGHVLKHLSTFFSQFLRRTCNKGVVQVTGEKVNRGGGHGLEVQCVYRLYGPEAYLDCLKKFLEDEEHENIAP